MTSMRSLCDDILAEWERELAQEQQSAVQHGATRTCDVAATSGDLKRARATSDEEPCKTKQLRVAEHACGSGITGAAEVDGNACGSGITGAADSEVDGSLVPASEIASTVVSKTAQTFDGP